MRSSHWIGVGLGKHKNWLGLKPIIIRRHFTFPSFIIPILRRPSVRLETEIISFNEDALLLLLRLVVKNTRRRRGGGLENKEEEDSLLSRLLLSDTIFGKGETGRWFTHWQTRAAQTIKKMRLQWEEKSFLSNSRACWFPPFFTIFLFREW